LQFAITRGINIRERRPGIHQALRIGNALSRAKYFQELIALPPNAAEQS
jgi:hypothetical protein